MVSKMVTQSKSLIFKILPHSFQFMSLLKILWYLWSSNLTFEIRMVQIQHHLRIDTKREKISVFYPEFCRYKHFCMYFIVWFQENHIAVFQGFFFLSICRTAVAELTQFIWYSLNHYPPQCAIYGV